MNIPTYLLEYFKGSSSQGHLKVMATIQSNNASQPEWALFFGIKGAKPGGDTDFKGNINGNATKKPAWERNTPLWFIPLSVAARTEAVEAGKTGVPPKIACDQIIIRNEGKGNSSRKDYKFWYDTEPAWKKDTALTLTPGTTLEELSGMGGEWLSMQAQGDAETWPVWLSSKNKFRNDRLVVFEAPPCQIIGKDGQSMQYQVWFGEDSLQPNFGRPFIEIDIKRDSPAPLDGNNYAIFWIESRKDDVFRPKVTSALAAESWVTETPVDTFFSQGKERPQEILKAFKGHKDSFDSYSWFIKEEFESGGEKFSSFSVMYLRFFLAEDALADHVGEKNLISIIQVCRPGDVSMMVRIDQFRTKSTDRFVKLWNSTAERIRNGLIATSASAPVGIVPDLDASSKDDYHYVSEWTSAYPKCIRDNENDFQLGKTLVIKDDKKASFECSLTLPLLRHQKFVGLPNKERLIVLKKASFSSSEDDFIAVNDNGTLYQVFLESYEAPALTNTTGPETIVLRDGAMAFVLGNPPGSTLLPTNKYGRLRLTLQLLRAQRPLFLWQWYKDINTKDDIVVSYAVDDFSLPVTRVDAAGQDMLARDRILAPRSIGAAGEGAGERSEVSLIIPLNKKASARTDAAVYFLTMSESVNVSQDHRFDMKLQEFNPVAGKEYSTSVRAVLLGSTPQFVAMVHARFLQQPGFDDGAWVLARRSPLSEEAGGWEILDDQADTEGFKLILPSQSIGEAYVKNDLIENDDHTHNITPGEPQENQPASYRLGAPSLLRIAPERLERRYVAAPWNLQRIWGQPGDVAPGVPFLEGLTEFIYGLQTHIDTQQGAFIAELASKLGEIPVPPVNTVAWNPTDKQKEAFRDAWQNFLEFYRAWKSRLAVLELSTDNDFGNTTFDKNLSFYPRVLLEPRLEKDVRTDLDVFTGQFDKKAGASLQLPMKDDEFIGPQKPDTDPDTILLNKIKAAHSKAPGDPDGLAGGFHYGFESPAIYKEFWREAYHSSSGEVKAPAFSSLGAWAQQVAKFARDKTIIRSVTGMGRTHFYAVERIGRIGVFWNKAKHVIEYERTVIPSPQFSHQPKHSGRVLIRKVREYIEILEPVRKFPDFATDAPDAPGSVTSCVFKSRIIPVLSSWGHDVWITKKIDGVSKKESIGWEVPLWKRGAEPELYPKPQVQITLLPPPDSDEKAIYSNLSDPENLWFYTDTREFVEKPDVGKIYITSDVHSWPAVKDVDYADLPEPVQYNVSPAAGDSLELIDAPLPSAIDIFPGFERFTFRVDSNDLPASVAGRYYSKSEISGRLRTVSMSRMEFGKTNGWWNAGDTNQQKARNALAQLVKDDGSVLAKFANGFTEIENRIRAGGKPPSIEEFNSKIRSLIGKSSGAAKELNALKQTLGDGIAEPRLNYLSALSGKIKDFKYYPSQWLWREALEGSEGMIHGVLSYYEGQKAIFLADLDALLQKGAESRNEAVDLLKQFAGKLREFHVFVEMKADSAVSAIKKIIDQATQSIESSIHGKFEEIHIAIDATVTTAPVDEIKAGITKKISQGFEATRRVVDDILDKLKKTEEANVLWQKAVKKIGDEITAAVDDAEKRLKDAVTKAAGEGAELIRNIKSAAHELTSEYETRIHNLLQPLFDNTNELVRKAKAELATINKELGKIGNEIEKNIDTAIEEIITAWKNGATILKDKVNGQLTSLKNTLGQFLVLKFMQALFDNTPSVYKLLKDLDVIFGQLEKMVISSLLSLFGTPEEIDAKITDWLNTLDSYKRLASAISSGNIEAILRESQALANSVNKEFGRLAGEVTDRLKDYDRLADATTGLVDTTKQTLNNFRSVWEEFTAPGMGFNRKTIAMLVKTDWKQVEERLSLTPCISRVKQFGEQLEGLGLRLPVASVTDRLLPAIKDAGKAALSQFDFSNLLSDLGGMRFDKLFPGFKMPEIARDKIKITQGFDKQNLIAWVDAEADIKLPGEKTLMSIGPVKITLENGVFTGKMRLEIGIDGKVRKTNSGQLIGTWHTNIGGTGLMIFKEAGVIFKNDKLTFDMDPRRMEMPGLLKMLTDASKTMAASGAANDPSGDGEKQSIFNIGIIKEREIPTGVLASLNIPPISAGGGTTAITNLSFGGFFMISALDKDLRFRFLLGLGFYLGKKDAPFNLTVFILGGGGYIDSAIYFEPKRGLSVDFVMSIHASAGLAVALGWMTGSITIMLGFEGEYHKRPDRSGGVYVSIFVHIIGYVDVLGLITVYLSLLLQATYRSLGTGGSELLGRGQVRLTIRICRFIKISVNKTYTKVFSRSGDGGTRSLTGADFLSVMDAARLVPPNVEQRASAILISFE